MEILKTELEIAFEKFNLLMESYNEDIANASSDLDRETIQKNYDELIEKEESKLEAAVEKDFEDSNKLLREQEDLFSKELKEQAEADEKALEEANEEVVIVNVEDEIREKYPTIQSLKKLKEKDLVDVAVKLGIDAKVSDLKKDTLNKVIAKLGY
jgi:Fe-S cluster assembly scaffold protein SufB